MKTVGARVALLVEDQSIIALAERHFLELGGYQVRWVLSGAEAIQASGQGVDIVLMDIDLGPGPNGFETATAILKDHDLPVVFLSSHSSEADAAMARTISPYGLVPKHLEPHLIVSSVSLALGQHDAQRLARREALEKHEAERLLSFGVWRLVEDRLELSEGAQEILGLDSGSISEAYYSNLIFPEDREARNRALEQAKERGGLYEVEYRVVRPGDGGIVRLRSRAMFSSGAPSTTGLVQAVPEHLAEKPAPASGQGDSEHQLRRELLACGERCLGLFTENKYPILVIDPREGQIVDANRAATVFYGWSLEELLGMRIGDINTLANSEVSAQMRVAIDESRSIFYFLHRLANGETREVSVLSCPVESRGRTLLYSTIIPGDSPRSVEFERLRNLWDLVEGSGDVLWSFDLKSSRFSYISPSVSHMRGLTVEEAMDQSFQDSMTPESFDRAQAILGARLARLAQGDLEALGPSRNRYRQYRRDGNIINVESITTIILGRDGQPRELIGVTRDITAQVESELARDSLLEEKDEIFSEFRSRVGNTLGILVTLLDLEEASLGVDNATLALKDARSRIITLSLLFENLFKSPDFRRISLRGYMTDLVALVAPPPAQDPGADRPADIQCYVEDVRVGVKLLFPLGIIVEELLSRALERGRSSGRRPAISLTLFQDANGYVEALVSDDGVEASEGATPGPGLELVHSLLDRMNGVIEKKAKEGNTYRIRIPPESHWA